MANEVLPSTPKGLYSRLKRDVKVRDHRVRYLVWRLRKICPWIESIRIRGALTLRRHDR